MGQKVNVWGRAGEGKRQEGGGGKDKENQASEQTACPFWGQQTPTLGSSIGQWHCTTLWVLTPRTGDWGLWNGRPLRNYLGFQVNALKSYLGSGSRSLAPVNKACPWHSLPNPDPLLACSLLFSLSACGYSPTPHLQSERIWVGG